MTLALFATVVFIAAGLMSVPAGPVQMSVWRETLAGRRDRAVAFALGGVLGDVGWAIAAVFGLNPWAKFGRAGAGVFLFYAALLFGLGFGSLLRTRVGGAVTPGSAKFAPRTDEPRKKPLRLHWTFLRGLTLVAFNPLGITIWAVLLAALVGWGAALPVHFPALGVYAVAVGVGAAIYPAIIVVFGGRLTLRLSPARYLVLIRCLDAGIIGLGLYFLYKAVRVLNWL